MTVKKHVFQLYTLFNLSSLSQVLCRGVNEVTSCVTVELMEVCAMEYTSQVASLLCIYTVNSMHQCQKWGKKEVFHFQLYLIGAGIVQPFLPVSVHAIRAPKSTQNVFKRKFEWLGMGTRRSPDVPLTSGERCTSCSRGFGWMRGRVHSCCVAGRLHRDAGTCVCV